jgi:hypothetical protein
MLTKRKMRHLDYEVKIASNKHREAGKWCEEHFGRRWEAIGYTEGMWAMFWSGRGVPGTYRFCFAEERDMLLFMLRWV